MNLTQFSDCALDCVFAICKRTIYRWAKEYCGIVPEGKCILTDKECDTFLHRVKKLENIVVILGSTEKVELQTKVSRNKEEMKEIM